MTGRQYASESEVTVLLQQHIRDQETPTKPARKLLTRIPIALKFNTDKKSEII